MSGRPFSGCSCCPLTALGGFPTAGNASQILTAFPFIDVGVFGDGEQTLAEICDRWRDRAELDHLPGTVVSSRPPQSVLEELRHHPTRIRKTSAAPLPVYFLGNEVVGRRQGHAVLVELLKGLIQLKGHFGSRSVFGELSPLDLTEEVACLLNAPDAALQLGFEQWRRVVALAHKRHRIIDGVQALKYIERYPNLRIDGFNLIVGFPGETLLDVAETKSNLWRLKFLLARLAARQRSVYLRGGLLRVNLRGLRMMQVALEPEIVKDWDFQNPFVQENRAHRPWTVLLRMMGADERLATPAPARIRCWKGRFRRPSTRCGWEISATSLRYVELGKGG